VDEARLERARRLLGEARDASRPLDQRLLVAAALSTVMEKMPTVVGGTAEEYWARDEYRPTDLDLIPTPSRADQDAFRKLGFKKDGRHWVSQDLAVATEFPHDSTFEVRRTIDARVGKVTVRVIGVDDLYLDRLGQATMTERIDDQHFASLLAITVTNWEQLDWAYVGGRIRETAVLRPELGRSMRKMHSICRRIARRELARQRARSL
jgi:hypothetical protein